MATRLQFLFAKTRQPQSKTERRRCALWCNRDRRFADFVDIKQYIFSLNVHNSNGIGCGKVRQVAANNGHAPLPHIPLPQSTMSHC
jgi:hypothetical protein